MVLAVMFLVGTAGALLTVSRAQAATDCPGTFRVLHNDRIGKASLPKGQYTIRLITTNPSFTCKYASTKFTQFLQDYDGRLGGGWTVKALAVGRAEFLQGGVRKFEVEKGSAPTPGPSPVGRPCPGSFRVLNNDRIGPLRFPKGNYKLVLPPNSAISCKQAANYFARFLDIPSGKLPGGWRIRTDTAVFYNQINPAKIQFRVDPMRPVLGAVLSPSKPLPPTG